MIYLTPKIMEFHSGENATLSLVSEMTWASTICGYLNCDIGDICEAVRMDN